MRINDIKDYFKWKIKTVAESKAYQNASFWINVGQFGSIITLLQGKTDLFLLNILIVFVGYLFFDIKKGYWRGEMRDDYRKKAIEQTGVKNGNQEK